MTQELYEIDYNGGKVYISNIDTITWGEYIYNTITEEVVEANDEWCGDTDPEWKRIAGQSPNLSLEGIPYVEIGEESVVLKAREDWKKSKAIMEKMGETTTLGQEAFFVSGYSFGYKAASANKFYTEEDLEKSYNEGCIDGTRGKGLSLEFIQSLKPKVKSIEVEMMCSMTSKNEDGYEYIPVTYAKELNGKMETFLKIKKVNYENN